MSPAPKPKASEVHERINALLSRAVGYLDADDPRAQMFIEEARESVQGDPVDGHLALASAYQLMGNFERALYHVDNALKLWSSNPVIYANKASICSNLGFFTQALEAYSHGADPEQGFMTTSWHCGFSCGAFQTMRDFLGRARAMKLDLGGMDTETAERAARVLDKVGVTDSDVAMVLDVAGEVLRNHRLFYLGREPEVTVVDEPDFSPFIRMVYRVGVKPAEAVDLYMEFVNRLTERMQTVPDVLTVSFQAEPTQ